MPHNITYRYRFLKVYSILKEGKVVSTNHSKNGAKEAMRRIKIELLNDAKNYEENISKFKIVSEWKLKK